ncbi:MAG TPA: nuclear transport factor 2 family protein [Caulobacteraceae bacterium]|nr:nuclear transport factor 2 family protein [Caulobacteraceae bacterium]
MTRTMLAGAATGLALGAMFMAAAGVAATHPAGPQAAVRRFVAAFNRGDVAAEESVHDADATIIDEFAPHIWRGAGAVRAWASDLEKSDKAAGDSNDHLVLAKPTRLEVEGHAAYAVFPATVTYTEKGKALAETGRMTFAFHRAAGAWKIAGWAWTGGAPHAAVTSATAKPAPKTAGAAKPKP